MKGRIVGLAHLGVAVKDPRARLVFWADLLGLPLAKVEAVPTEGVRTWFLDAGATHVELLEPLGEDSTIARHIERRGEGLHHLALAVDDLDAVLARLASREIAPIGGVRVGAGGARVAFLHPRDAGGVLVELTECAESAEADAPSTGGQAFQSGELVVVNLRDPRQQVVGVLRRLDGAGVAVEGLDVDSWDGWLSQHRRGEDGPVRPSLEFFPLARVEKVIADADSPELPSFRRRFEERTGKPLSEVLSGARGIAP